jgi:hypothetical protein
MVSTSDEAPSSESSELCLAHPTSNELVAISMGTAAMWKDALSLPAFLEEYQVMATAPLARGDGMTTWVLVDKNTVPGQRQIFSSCESYRKRALRSDTEGIVVEVIIHGIASVFCASEYRGRGYPKRMMRELSTKLFTWHTTGKQCVGSILYSDIGKSYYAGLGWKCDPSNTHIELRPLHHTKSPLARPVLVTHLPDLCKRDEALIRTQMACPTQDSRPRVSIVPDLDHIGWHLAKEEFACNYLFGKTPHSMGAIAGSPGNQVWALWTHRYYDHPDVEKPNNVLYILRLVMEADETITHSRRGSAMLNDKEHDTEQILHLEAVLQAAQTEALTWKLDTIQLWNPSPLVIHILEEIGMHYEVVEREKESIASGLWYDEHGGISDLAPLWLNNEHYAWC